MAKTKHNNLLDTIDELITNAKDKGIVHLYTEDEEFTGRRLLIKGKNMYHFGTTGYLGLEQDMRLKQAAVDAIMKYGTQFPLSKTYLSFGIYKELEESLFQMYENPVVVTKNSTLGHLSVIPTIVRDEDAVILDQQVHSSVQSAVHYVKPRGIRVEVIRHNNLDMLEEKIKELAGKYNKIWYMVDGVYSMYGDCAPIPELLKLMDKYEQFHVYVDDVHGMSWAGKNGTGYVMSQLEKLPEKMILTATLSKSFGASGSMTVFPNYEIYRKTKNFGGPLTFSAQLEPSSVAAALASAKIHLSPEIYQMQNELAEKVAYCNSLIRDTNLPIVEENRCPVFFVGTGIPAIGYNFVSRLMNEGFYVNVATFPVVPVKNTGVRFTVSRHNTMEDIKALVEAMEYHYPKALEDENYSNNSVRKAFRLPLIEEKNNIKTQEGLKLHHYNSILKIDKKEWNELHGDKGVFDWDGLLFLENVFTNNIKKEHTWNFNYYIVKDRNNRIVLSTWTTAGLWKDDVMSPAEVSMKIEAKRATDPYYLTSTVISTGSVFTEGDHLYLDKSHHEWKEAMKLLLEAIANEDEKINATMQFLRDFEDNDEELKDFLLKQGFVKVDLPEACIVEELNWKSVDEYLTTLSYKSRKHFRNDILKYEQYFDVEIKSSLTNEEMEYAHQLFNNVKSRNFDINTFGFPKKLFLEMALNPNWEFIELKLKKEFDDRKDRLPVAIMFCYKNSGKTYCPAFIGMDYEYLGKYQVYRQALYQTLKRANQIQFSKIDFGFSATFEKKKIGARIIPKVGYVQAKDNFNLEMIEAISVQKQAS
jgi:7-keto-8-aminopelargonate synthetase-like enzyme